MYIFWATANSIVSSFTSTLHLNSSQIPKGEKKRKRILCKSISNQSELWSDKPIMVCNLHSCCFKCIYVGIPINQKGFITTTEFCTDHHVGKRLILTCIFHLYLPVNLMTIKVMQIGEDINNVYCKKRMQDTFEKKAATKTPLKKINLI